MNREKRVKSENGSANLERFTGLADLYDVYRPQAPPVIVDMTIQLAQVTRPGLVVDLGSGTGLSTFIWADRVDAVIGIEPNGDMRRVAELRKTASPGAANVRFRDTVASQTGLPDGCADIVTCAQALHWMEPESTFDEVARILRPGGVFAAYSYRMPTVHWEIEAASLASQAQIDAILKEIGEQSGLQMWSQEEHLNQMRASGHFCYVKETWVHHVGMVNAEQWIGSALSSSITNRLLEEGFSEAEVGLERLRAVAERVLGDQSIPCYFSYEVLLGVR
jgi:ubiquinone/menaquinone biosynthesis C-methylase UbiE